MEKEYFTLVFWPGEFHGLYIHGVRKELDNTDRLSPSLSKLSLTVLRLLMAIAESQHPPQLKNTRSMKRVSMAD